MEFLAGMGFAYLVVGLALLVRDATTMKVTSLLDYPRWAAVLWRKWARRNPTVRRPKESA